MNENSGFAMDVEDLYTGAIHSVPVHVSDWQAPADEEYPELGWWESLRVDFEGRTVVVVVQDSGQRVTTAVDTNGNRVDLDDDDAINTYLEENSDEDGEPVPGAFEDGDFQRLAQLDLPQAQGPQMSHMYPLEGIDEDTARTAALELRDVSLCVVQVNGTFGVALTGGGMDMSWDICEAFVAVGYLPPIHFADLPNLAGERANRYVLEAMLRSLDVAAERARYAAELLNEKFPPPTYEYEVQGKQEGGWEMVTTETTPEAADEQLRTYRANDPATEYRVKKVIATS